MAQLTASLEKEAKTALEEHDEKKLRAVVDRAHKYGVEASFVHQATDSLKTLEQAEHQFMDKKLAAASKRNDLDSVVRISADIRARHLRKNVDKYELRAAPHLQLPDDWAKMKFFAWDRTNLAQGMLSYTDEVIHAPLTKLPVEAPGVSQELKDAAAVALFEQIIQYQTSGDVSIPGKILQTVLDSPYLCNELYCQLLKQLTNSPTGWPRDRGWKLLGLCVKHIAPQGIEMQCIVEAFLTRNGATFLVPDLQQAVFGHPPQFREAEAPVQLRRVQVPTGSTTSTQTLVQQALAKRMC